MPSTFLGDGNLEMNPLSSSAQASLAAGHRVSEGAQRGREVQIREKRFARSNSTTPVLPKTGAGGARRCPTSTTAGEVCKSGIERGKLTWEIQDSLESMISLIENKFSSPFKKCYTGNAAVAKSSLSKKLLNMLRYI